MADLISDRLISERLISDRLSSDRLEAASRVSEPLSQQPAQERGGRARRRPRPPVRETEPELEGPAEGEDPPHKVDSLA